MDDNLSTQISKIYDPVYPGLEYDWKRLCVRFKNSYRYDFAGKNFDQILSDFSAQKLPLASKHLIETLSNRHILSKLKTDDLSLIDYAETLRKNLDEFTEENELHLVEVISFESDVFVSVSLFLPEAAPLIRSVIHTNRNEDKIKSIPQNEINLIEDSLCFVRQNNQFQFSKAMAHNDANNLIGFILANHSHNHAPQLTTNI